MAKAQLRMETSRNFTQISRETGTSNQNLQHFMSNSPRSAQAVYRQIQEEIKEILSPKQAIEQVVEHLINRTLS